MNPSFLVMKCDRCGSVSHLSSASITDGPNLCPVCNEGSLELLSGEYDILVNYAFSFEDYSPN